MTSSSVSAALPGAPHFHYTHGVLHVEDLPCDVLTRQWGTPLFVISQAALMQALDSYRFALQGRRAQIHYAMKANSSHAILQFFARQGLGVDIVSGGELARALHAGFAPDKVVFSGVGKTQVEMQQALELGIACFNVESAPELEALNRVALRMGLRAPVALRVNPDIDAKTHPYISTGLTHNKFGIPHPEALELYARAHALPGIAMRGLDCHIGSQITQVQPYLDMVDRMLDLADALRARGLPLHHLDLGGGLGIQYQDEAPPAAQDLWQAMLARVDSRGYRDMLLTLEPGRSLVGNAVIALTQVLYTKKGPHKNFCIVDAAMNDLPRPAMYEAWHQMLPLRQHDDAPSLWDVVGPVCESGDWLGRQRRLSVQVGDSMAIFSAGAYCMSMASNYNSRPRAAEVWVHGDQHALVHAREGVDDFLRHARDLPDFAKT